MGRLRYHQAVLDVPANTLVRDVSERLPPGAGLRLLGKSRRPHFERVEVVAAATAAGQLA